MVRSLLTLICCLSLSTLLSAQMVDRSQQSLIMKVTATWCGPCGSWGWDLFEGLNEDINEGAVLMATHYSGDLVNPTAAALAANVSAMGQPQFYVNLERQPTNSSNGTMQRSLIGDLVAQRFQTGAEVGLVMQRTSDTELTTTVEFFAGQTGNYRVAIYAIEDDVINRQTNRGANAEHKRVLRGSLGEIFGDVIVTGSAAEGERQTHVQTLNLDDTWNTDNLVLTAVVWRELDDGKFAFVNAFELEDWQSVTSSTQQQLDPASFAVTSFSESGVLTSRVQLGAVAQGVTLNVVDAQGRVLGTRSLGDQPIGTVDVTWSELTLPIGYYVLRLETQEGVLASPTIVR